MKKTTSVLWLILMILALLTGCGGGEPKNAETREETEEATPEPPDERKTDGEFVEALQRALTARWDISAEYTAKDLSGMSAADYQNYLRRCVDAEEEQLGSIVDYRFLDGDLAALAQQYYYALALQREGAAYARTGSVNEYNRTWILGYNYRVSTVFDLTREFSFRVPEEYDSRLNELLATVYDAKKQVAFQELIQHLPDTLTYEKDPSRSNESQTCFVGEVANTTDYDIRSMSVGVSFLDEEGKILYQTSDWISDLRTGQSARSTIFAPVENYAGVQYSISIYQ